MHTRAVLVVTVLAAAAACGDTPDRLTQPSPDLSPSPGAASFSTSSNGQWQMLGTMKVIPPIALDGTVKGENFGATMSDAPTASAQPDILYWDGPLIQNMKSVSIYLGSAPIYNGGPGPGTRGDGYDDRSLVGYFLDHLGGSSRYNVNTMYYEVKGTTKDYVRNSMDYTSFWATGEVPAKPGDLVSINAMINIIEKGFSKGSIKYDPNTLYQVFTGYGVNLGGGFDPNGLQYCAWHWAYYRGNGTVVQFGAQPYDATFTPTHPSNDGYVCQFYAGPNGDIAADAEVNTIAHELEETATDPFINELGGWFDIQGNESSDKCAWTFGRGYAQNGGFWNVAIGAKRYLVQQQWALTKPQSCLKELSIRS